MICFRISVPLSYILLILSSLYPTCRFYKVSGSRLTTYRSLQLVAGQHPCTIQAATKEWLTQSDLQPLREADVDGKKCF